MIEGLAEDLRDKNVQFFKVDINEAEDVAVENDVVSVPRIMVYKVSSF